MPAYEVEDFKNEPRPAIDLSFEILLDDLSREYNVPLRLVWAPEREQREMAGLGGANRGYSGKRYCTRWVGEHIGWYKCRYLKRKTSEQYFRETGERWTVQEEVLNYYRDPEALPEKFPRDSEAAYGAHFDEVEGVWWKPDWLEEQVAPGRWVIEERMAGVEHEELLKGSYNPDTNEYIREIAEVPDEGVWNCLLWLGDHRSKMVMDTAHGVLRHCCEIANDEGYFCPGLYRPPGPDVLENLKRAIQTRNAIGMFTDENTVNNRAVERVYRERMAAFRKREADQLNKYKEIAKNNIAPALYGLIPKVDMGSIKPIHLK